MGVRMGSAEIYNAVESLAEVRRYVARQDQPRDRHRCLRRDACLTRSSMCRPYHVHGQRDPALRVAGDRQICEAAAQAPDVDAAGGETVVERTVPAPVLAGQRQLGQRDHRSVGAQQRAGELEQRIAAQRAAVIATDTQPAN